MRRRCPSRLRAKSRVTNPRALGNWAESIRGPSRGRIVRAHVRCAQGAQKGQVHSPTHCRYRSVRIPSRGSECCCLGAIHSNTRPTSLRKTTGRKSRWQDKYKGSRSTRQEGPRVVSLLVLLWKVAGGQREAALIQARFRFRVGIYQNARLRRQHQTACVCMLDHFSKCNDTRPGSTASSRSGWQV